ncbi:MAG TPA: phosphotransferase family protein [Xanthomonadales bacterium]|nr:phosphotransferase family protein [Xanthomonadales bacterium]
MSLDAGQLESLTTWLAKQGSQFADITACTQLKGGQSNPTYRLDTGAGPVILRKRPAGAEKWAHDVRREFTVLSALAGTDVPVPRPYVYCDDEELINGAFYLMDFVDGRIVDDCTMPGFDPAERHAVYQSFAETIAKFHAVDYHKVGLAEFGRPEGFVERQLALHTRLFGQYCPAGNADMAWLAEALREHRPETQRLSIIHNDIRLGNVVLHPTEPRVIAILDWEMSSLGDQWSDAAFMLLPYHLPEGNPQGSFANVDREKLGIPSAEDMVRWYCDGLGADAFPDRDYLICFALYRYASVYAGIADRHRQGKSVSDDAHRYAAAVAPTARAARELAEATFAN